MPVLLMPEIEWASLENAKVKEKFGGRVRVRTLWQSPSGATAQVVEFDPGACWEGIDVHLPGPEEVFVVSGVFNDGVRDYPAGSFIHNPAGSSHVPQSATGCTLFVFYPEG
jgi:anti-sigma factor ChrR (cupin superfamily)